MKRVMVGCFAALTFMSTAASALAADTIKIGFLEGLSSSFAEVGEQGLKSLQWAVDKVNAKGGVLGKKLQLVPFDTKSNPQEAAIQLQKAADQGIQFITQGNGSNVASVLIEGTKKIYQRNPKQPVLYLNYAAVAPEFTGEKASFLHFRFDANTDMKMVAIARYLSTRKDCKKVYVIGQDYSHGRSVSAAAKRYLKQFRPDVKIVGDELHPMGKVKDFSPYIAKIRASGADTVITGNWGNDMVLLVKAGNDAGLKVNWFTFYGNAAGAAPAIGEGGVGRVYQVNETRFNDGSPVQSALMKFEKDYRSTFQYLRTNTEIVMLAKAIEHAKTTDPIKVAKALEGLRTDSGVGEVWMRPDDHQLMGPLYVSVMERAGKGQKLPFESTPGSGYGFRTIATIAMKDVILPNTARIARP